MAHDHPALTAVEDEKGQIDIGVMLYRIFLGARQEGASRLDAVYVIAGWLVGSMNSEEGAD